MSGTTIFSAALRVYTSEINKPDFAGATKQERITTSPEKKTT
jgi:hypothetical protein